MGRLAVRPIRPEEAWYRIGDLTELVFAFPQCFLGALALDELTDLAADGSQHVEQLLIGLPDLTTEKLDHAQDFAPEQDGKTEGRM